VREHWGVVEHCFEGLKRGARPKEALACDVGSPIVELTVRADNPAQNFYRRNGFRPLPECLTFVIAGSALAALANQDPEKLALTG